MGGFPPEKELWHGPVSTAGPVSTSVCRKWHCSVPTLQFQWVLWSAALSIRMTQDINGLLGRQQSSIFFIFFFVQAAELQMWLYFL